MKSDEEEEPNQIACSKCQSVFTPDWKQREGFLTDEEYAVCPHCGEENIFEVEEEDDEDEEQE